MYAEVILAEYLHRSLTYKIPVNLESQLKVGHAVLAPLRNRTVLGYIYSVKSEHHETFALKDILEIKSELTFFNEKTLQLLEWLAHYYATSITDVNVTLKWKKKCI